MNPFRNFPTGIWVLLLLCLSQMAVSQPTNCLPTFTYGCTDNDGLNRFIFNGLELSKNTGCNANQTYVFPVADVAAGQTYPFSGTLLSQSYQEGITIWLDLNRNNVFETGEQIYQTPNVVVGSFTGNLSIPATATPGSFVMRVLVRYNAIPTNPCGAYDYGEVEHYTLNIANGSCVPPSGIFFNSAPQSSPNLFSAIIEWNSANGANGYEVSLSDAVGGATSAFSTTVTSPSILLNLNYDKSYILQLRSRCTTGGTSSYATATFNTPSSCPFKTPTSLTATNITSSSALLDWSYNFSTGYISGYDIQYRVQGTTAWNTISNPSDIFSEYKLTNLEMGTAYQWQVRNRCNNNEVTSWVGPASFTTVALPCEATGGLAAYDATNSSIQLYWYQASLSRQYIVQYQPITSTAWLSASVTAANSTTANDANSPNRLIGYVLAGLNAATTYRFRVGTICSSATSIPYSGTASFTTLANCAPPTSVSIATPAVVRAGGSYSITALANWSVASTAVSYDVKWYMAGFPDMMRSVSSLSGTSYTLTDLNFDAAYIVEIRSRCSNGVNSAVASTTFNTPLSCPLKAPVSLTTTGISSSSAHLDWSFGSPNLSYPQGFDLQWRVKGSVNWNNVNNLSLVQSEYSLTGLMAGTLYEWQVRSRCSTDIVTNWVGPVEFTTLGGQCSTPVGLAVSGFTTPTATTGLTTTVSWSLVTGAVSYEVRWQTNIGGSVVNISNGITTNTQQLTGLTTNTTYIIQIRATCAGGQLSGFAQSTLTTPNGTTNSTGSSTLEYFFDTDPGYGNGTVVPGFVMSTVATPFTFQVPMPTGLSDGLHSLYLRAKDGSGTWSMVGTRPFFKDTYPSQATPLLGRIEYFIDTDPGYEMASVITNGSSSTALNNLTFTVSMPQNLPDGLHFLFVRARHVLSNNWSIIGIRPFYKDTYPSQPLPAITRLEYFVDSDPGFGNGSALTGYSSGTAINNFSAPIQLTGLTSTTHTVYIRAQDANGRWSLLGARSFTFDGTVVVCPLMYTVKDGNWTDPTVWSCGRLPTAADAVQVKHRVTLPGGSLALAKQIALDTGARVIYGVGSTVRLGF